MKHTGRSNKWVSNNLFCLASKPNNHADNTAHSHAAMWNRTDPRTWLDIYCYVPPPEVKGALLYAFNLLPVAFAPFTAGSTFPKESADSRHPLYGRVSLWTIIHLV